MFGVTSISLNNVIPINQGGDGVSPSNSTGPKDTLTSDKDSSSEKGFFATICTPFTWLANVVGKAFASVFKFLLCCCCYSAKLTDADIKILKDVKAKTNNDRLSAYQELPKHIRKVILGTAKEVLDGEVKENKITQEKADGEIKALADSFTDKNLAVKDIQMRFINMAIANYEKASVPKEKKENN